MYILNEQRHKDSQPNNNSKLNPKPYLKIVYNDHMGFIQETQGQLNIGRSINVVSHISRTKSNNPMIILIATEKDVDRIQYTSK